MKSNRELVDYLVKFGIIRSARVKSAFLAVDRSDFVPEMYKDYAYADEPLSIGFNQTISAPHIIAEMVEILDIHPDHKVLEIGTGSGYQTAILAELASKGTVYSIELFPELMMEAKEKLGKYKNVRLFLGSGYTGLPEYAPFDRIILSCAPTQVPNTLTSQLSDGGKMILPLGPSFSQRLVIVEKKDDEIIERDLGIPVSFVPMLERT